jgi:hypothetical protein
MQLFFFIIVNQLKTILGEIESRSSRKEYAQILSECHNLFCEQRLYLVSYKGISFVLCSSIT